jgi:predicted DNA-binding transcriptional regulator AlpA
MRRLESKAAATRRTRSEFDNYSDSILLSEPEAAAVTGFSPHTLKFWRLTRSPKGPRPTYLHGMVRYQAGEIRRWRAEIQVPKAA